MIASIKSIVGWLQGDGSLAADEDTFIPTTPCMGVCQLDPANGWCRGCYRTLEEIAGWPTYGMDEKRAVFERIEQRRTTGDVAND